MAIRTPQMLHRWSAFAPGSRMPDSLDELSAEQVLRLQNADEDLFALLGNSASAELELAALNNTLAEVAPTAQQRHDAATAARIAELVAANPFQAGGSLTDRFELEALAPEAAAQLQAAAAPTPAPMHEGDRLAYLRHGYAVPAQS